MTLAELAALRCEPRKGSQDLLSPARVGELLGLLAGWKAAPDGKAIGKTFRFDNFYQTLGFVNAIGWMANRQDHHPDLEVGYNRCAVHWSTHDVGGLSLNDFICAARVNAIATA
ncbi:MAG: 4a-hydroxytetrahydrobiopterin dehydratase [Rhodanobacteraceae bacterium]|nr:MAG: 4a-hydroxytetrahydrobiopterin dehydratase [Rhodanobacteraceae bacterium]